MTKRERNRRMVMTAIAMLMTAWCMVACTEGIVYDHYEPIPESGLDRRDTITFLPDTVAEAGVYATTLSIRLHPDYPYTNISLGVEQTVTHDSVQSRRYRKMHFELVDEKGASNGQGVRYRVFSDEAFTDSILPGDSIYIKVFHNMRRENIPGISDIGISLSRSNAMTP